MRKAIVTVAACASVLWVSTAQAATPEQKCLAGLAKAKGKYEQCVEKFLARGYGGGDFDSTRIAKCREKYAAAWTKLSALVGSTTCSGIPRFTDNGTTVSDNLTGLTWEKKTTVVGSGTDLGGDRHDVDNLYSWSLGGANGDGTTYSDFLSNLNGGGGFAATNDWRLPTFAELQTIVLPPPCSVTPCIDATFGSTQSNAYWSATTYAGDPSDAWYVGFNSGGVLGVDKPSDRYVRAVRGGL